MITQACNKWRDHYLLITGSLNPHYGTCIATEDCHRVTAGRECDPVRTLGRLTFRLRMLAKVQKTGRGMTGIYYLYTCDLILISIVYTYRDYISNYISIFFMILSVFPKVPLPKGDMVTSTFHCDI